MDNTILTFVLIATFVAVSYASYVLGCIVTMRRMSTSFAREIFSAIQLIKALAETGKAAEKKDEPTVAGKVDMHV